MRMSSRRRQLELKDGPSDPERMAHCHYIQKVRLVQKVSCQVFDANMLRNTHWDGINSKLLRIWRPATIHLRDLNPHPCGRNHRGCSMFFNACLFGSRFHQTRRSLVWDDHPPRLGRLRTSPRDECGLPSAICAIGVARAASWGAAFSSWLNLPKIAKDWILSPV